MSMNILVVDDELEVARLFQRRFRKELRDGAYAFHFASSAEMALERLADQLMPGLMLILSDINMPGMSGIDLLSQVRDKYPKLPVVMITAYDDAERREQARRLGATHYLTKPIDFERLKAELPKIAPSKSIK